MGTIRITDNSSKTLNLSESEISDLHAIANVPLENIKEKYPGLLVFPHMMLASILSSCVTKTHVTFNTDTPGADVYINGEYIGKTPVTKKLSNSIWEDPDILIRKDGYQDMHFQVQKEVKTVNLICGLLLWWPSLFWVHGPKGQQHYMLTPIK